MKYWETNRRRSAHWCNDAWDERSTRELVRQLAADTRAQVLRVKDQENIRASRGQRPRRQATNPGFNGGAKNGQRLNMGGHYVIDVLIVSRGQGTE